MKEEMDQLVAAGKIHPKHVASLTALMEAGFCQHKSWGFGKVKTLDGIAGRLLIDFHGKPGHAMDLTFSAESLRPISKDHILAQKHSNLKGLQQMAALHHLEVVKLVLDSHGGRATADQIQAMLVPDVIQSDWKKWWEAARAELKKDGHFLVPLKKTDPVVYQAEELPMAARLRAEFQAARGLKARVAVAHEVLRSLPDISDPALVDEVIAQLNADIQSHLNTRQSETLEGIFVRDDLRVAAQRSAPEGETAARDVWSQRIRLREIFDELPAAKHRRTLESFRDSVPDWAPQIVLLINDVPAKLAGEAARILLQENKGPLLKDTLARLISQHGASSELLLWFGKERNDYFADLLTPEVFRSMLTAIERDQFLEKKNNRLRDHVLEDQQLLPDLIESADIEVIRDLTRTLQLSPSFDDMDKRSLLARIVKMYPAIQEMITGEHSREDRTFLVSWASLERRKGEYEDLVQKAIPANVRDIALARSYGDLRENAEYKFAKEQQKVLNRRKHELEAQLSRARGTDFTNARGDVASIGTSVTVTNLDSGQPEVFHLLGAWDGDPDRGILSYLSPLAQALLGKGAGAEVAAGEAGSRRRFRIEAIGLADPALWTPALRPEPAAPEPEPAAPAVADAPPTAPPPDSPPVMASGPVGNAVSTQPA
ncbi:MAG: GreA/GreB family elongation factor [Verrucomicrobiae bacterium]|nr:GreA/GreB family elongation factor [Verrucomicrobiae bacterium]